MSETFKPWVSAQLFSPAVRDSQDVNSSVLKREWTSGSLVTLILHLEIYYLTRQLVTVTSVYAIYDATSFWNLLANIIIMLAPWQICS